MNQDPRGTPEVGDVILIRGVTLRAWFPATVTGIEGDHIITGSGMGTRSHDVRQYGKTWKWPARTRVG